MSRCGEGMPEFDPDRPKLTDFLNRHDEEI